MKKTANHGRSLVSVHGGAKQRMIQFIGGGLNKG